MAAETIPTMDNLASTSSHVVFLREKLLRTKEDRYIVNMAEALRHSGHGVTILTSEFDPNDCLPELDVS